MMVLRKRELDGFFFLYGVFGSRERVNDAGDDLDNVSNDFFFVEKKKKVLGRKEENILECVVNVPTFSFFDDMRINDFLTWDR